MTVLLIKMSRTARCGFRADIVSHDLIIHPSAIHSCVQIRVVLKSRHVYWSSSSRKIFSINTMESRYSKFVNNLIERITHPALID